MPTKTKVHHPIWGRMWRLLELGELDFLGETVVVTFFYKFCECIMVGKAIAYYRMNTLVPLHVFITFLFFLLVL